MREFADFLMCGCGNVQMSDVQTAFYRLSAVLDLAIIFLCFLSGKRTSKALAWHANTLPRRDLFIKFAECITHLYFFFPKAALSILDDEPLPDW
jgi:hypothetical protein